MTIPVSILDLAPIPQGSTAAQALQNTLDLARHAERWGCQRFWVAEHHGMPGIASAATSVVIAFLAAGTSHIRVGSGGIMLPNHAPLVIAEQFGTLESLYRGRIDLGLGRAPGTDQPTARALRRNLTSSGDTFPQDLEELMSYFEAGPHAGRSIRAVPGEGLEIPIWLLGSSLFSAQLAAQKGLPFAFASHFAPELLLSALQVYRSQFQPSRHLEKPYAMVAVNVFAADTEAEARRLFTSLQQASIRLVRNVPGQLPPPVDPEDLDWNDMEEHFVRNNLRVTAVGTSGMVREQLQQVLDATQPDELMLTSMIYDHVARVRSLEMGVAALK